ncbi:MAG TPA: hypothetical protein VIF64_04580 [Pyrinomonadaceae bacterium]
MEQNRARINATRSIFILDTLYLVLVADCDRSGSDEADSNAALDRKNDTASDASH